MAGCKTVIDPVTQLYLLFLVVSMRLDIETSNGSDIIYDQSNAVFLYLDRT